MQKQYFKYIDSLRGFAIFLIVLCHVGMWCMNISNNASNYYHKYFELIQIPLFFFISGFVLYKPYRLLDNKSIKKILIDKIPFLVLSPIIFLYSLCYVNNEDFLSVFIRWDKGGYWFVYSLFEYYILYVLLNKVLNLFGKSNISKIFDILLLFVAFALIYISIPNKFNLLSNDISNIIGIERSRFFIYFSLGILIRKYMIYIEYIIENKKKLLCLCILTHIILIIYKPIFVAIIPITFINLITISTGVVIFFLLFKSNEQFFTESSIVGSFLYRIGKRTLDIYYIHYFFIKTNIGFFLPDFNKINSPVIEFSIAILISIIVILFCLCVSEFLRLSSVLSYFLFGKKN